MSGETPDARETIDKVIETQRDSCNEAKVPFDPEYAKRKAREAALRHDRRNNR